MYMKATTLTEYYAVFTGKRTLTVIPVRAQSTEKAFQKSTDYKRFGLMPLHLLLPDGTRVPFLT